MKYAAVLAVIGIPVSTRCMLVAARRRIDEAPCRLVMTVENLNGQRSGSFLEIDGRDSTPNSGL